MKNTVILFLFVFGLTSCSKDSLDESIDPSVKPVKSEIMIQVTYLSWADQCENTCGSTGNQVVTKLANAEIELYHGDQNQSDSGISMMNARTDSDGSALLQDIEPGLYTVFVTTPLGNKSRTLTTQLHRRAYIDFSF